MDCSDSIRLDLIRFPTFDERTRLPEGKALPLALSSRFRRAGSLGSNPGLDLAARDTDGITPADTAGAGSRTDFRLDPMYLRSNGLRNFPPSHWCARPSLAVSLEASLPAAPLAGHVRAHGKARVAVPAAIDTSFPAR